MAVVTHHPVVVHLEGVFGSRFAVDADFILCNLKVVAFVGTDAALVDGDIVEGELESLSRCCQYRVGT